MNFLDDSINKYIQNFLKLEPNLILSIGITSSNHEEVSLFSNNFPNNKDYLYEIGSISKVYLSCLLAKLIFEKKINLEDSIDKYLKLPKDRIYPTVLSLATHTSGYCPLISFSFIWRYLLKNKNMRTNLYYKVKSERIYEQIHAIKLKNKTYPYHYSDMNAAVLGEVISQVENKPFDEVMQAFLEHDLGLSNTFLASSKLRNIESYYRKKIRYHFNWDYGDVYAPAGGLLTTIDDALKFLKMQIEKQPEFISLTQKKHVRIIFFRKPMMMGLGWHMYPDGNYMFHKGGTSCFRASYLVEKKRKIGIAVLANVIGNRVYNTTKLSIMLCKKAKEEIKKDRVVTTLIKETNFS
ncbi:MAG: serine hydrolase domain-containing protein [Bacilli bacterium]